MIPQFPSYRKLQIEDKKDIEEYINKFPPYADYNFLNLYCFNTQEKIEISVLNNNLVVLFEDYISGDFFYSFFGKEKIEETAESLLVEAKKRQISPVLCLVPEFNIENQNISGRFLIEEDLDNHDYIFSVDDLSEYKGSKFHKKRNLVKLFKKLYPNYSVRSLDLQKQNIKDQIMEMFFAWERSRKKTRDDTNHELIAIERLLKASSNFALYCQGVFVNNKMIAFTIKEILPNNYSIIHFEKNDIAYDGISSLLRQESARYLKELGCKYINFQQDLGISGLRKAKQLWKPIKFLKKYKISWRI